MIDDFSSQRYDGLSRVVECIILNTVNSDQSLVFVVQDNKDCVYYRDIVYGTMGEAIVSAMIILQQEMDRLKESIKGEMESIKRKQDCLKMIQEKMEGWRENDYKDNKKHTPTRDAKDLQ